MSIKYDAVACIYRLDGGWTTSGAIRELQQLIAEGKIIPEKFTKANLRYNVNNGFGCKWSEEFYPLKFESGNEEVWVSSVSAGYRGTGPFGTVEALKLMGFAVDAEMEKVIFGKRITNEVFIK